MKSLLILMLLTAIMPKAFTSGTYVVPPPKPKVDCSQEQNKSKAECEGKTESEGNTKKEMDS